MTEIILTSTTVATEGDVELVGLRIITRDEDWFGFYDRLQVFRSTQGEGGPYEELTAANWKVPRLPVGAGNQPTSPVTGPLINIVGETLSLLANKIQVDITFTGSDPLTYAQVATQITAQGQSRVTAYVDADGGIVIEGTYPGLLSSLEVVETTAAVLLSLPSGVVAYGADARPSLDQNKLEYTLVDYFGSRSYFYRTRFIHALTGAQSAPSAAFSADVSVLTDAIIGFVTLIDQTGNALVGAEVRTYTEFTGMSIVNGLIVVGGTQVKLTDENGRAEFQLARGQKVTVSIQGTDIVRTITVPTDEAISEFSLLDPSISDADIFKAVVPDIITAERRSL